MAMTTIDVTTVLLKSNEVLLTPSLQSKKMLKSSPSRCAELSVIYGVFLAH